MDYDATPLPDRYSRARRLGPDAIEVWHEAILRLLPRPVSVARALDLGCGTGRFTRLLSRMLGAAVVGIDPSLRMLAGREGNEPGRGLFVAGHAEALPLADRSVDLVFLSMVYHHFRAPAAAIGEMRRALTPGGTVIVRNPTREGVPGFAYLQFFPDALALDLSRMPPREGLIEAFAGHGFECRGHELVLHPFAEDAEEYVSKIGQRGISSLQVISDEAFAHGLRDFTAWCRSTPPPGPIREPVDLFVFVRD